MSTDPASEAAPHLTPEAAELLNCLPGDDGRVAPSVPVTVPEEAALQPLAVPTTRVIIVGSALWALALLVTLVVPSLHSGPRSWWPWACVTGLALGAIGYLYVRRGRGNAADAE